MLFEKLSPEHLKMIDEYRYTYAGTDACYINGPWADLVHVLRFWDKEKSNYLYQLLGKQITISKEVSYRPKDDILTEKMFQMKAGRLTVSSRKEYNGRLFCDEYIAAVTKIRYANGLDSYWHNNMTNLLDSYYLIRNQYTGIDFECPMPNGKVLHINSKTKLMKILGKLAKAYNIPGFEDFRIAHSLILNQNSLSGKLTLSIHPLDYMTMSDNNCGWESCMNWVQAGSYRQGTVEMMNSKSVVVAYLESNEPYVLPYGKEWNNKKWRQLFVVDPKAILGIKSYPYANDELSNTCLDWLKDLAHENLGWNYQEIMEYNPEDGIVLEDGGPSYYIEVETGHMYNDVGCANTHYLALGEGMVGGNFINNCGWDHTMILPYSGPSECIVCGAEEPDLQKDSSLVCDNCCNYSYCDYCEDEAPVDELIEIDGMMICQCCYDNQVERCQVCGEEHMMTKMNEVRVLPRLSQEYMKQMRDKWANRDWDRGDYTPINPMEEEFNFSVRCPSGYACDCCEPKWKEMYLVNSEVEVKVADIAWSEDNYVYLDELNEERVTDLDLFSTRQNETMEEYNQRYIEWLETRYGVAYGYPMNKRDS